jgi:hypothetical protein
MAGGCEFDAISRRRLRNPRSVAIRLPSQLVLRHHVDKLSTYCTELRLPGHLHRLSESMTHFGRARFHAEHPRGSGRTETAAVAARADEASPASAAISTHGWGGKSGESCHRPIAGMSAPPAATHSSDNLHGESALGAPAAATCRTAIAHRPEDLQSPSARSDGRHPTPAASEAAPRGAFGVEYLPRLLEGDRASSWRWDHSRVAGGWIAVEPVHASSSAAPDE